MSKLPDEKQMEFAGHFAARFPTLAGKKEPTPQRIEATAKALDNVTGASSATKAFIATEFVALGIPYDKPNIEKAEDLLHSMQAGNRSFEVTGHPSVGLPYGNDYLAALFIDTAYQMLGCPENRVITFRSSTDVLRFLHLLPGEDWKGWIPDGRRIKGILGAFDRMAHATFFAKEVVTAVNNKTGKVTGRGTFFERYQLIDRYKLWVDTKTHPNQHTLDFKDGKRQLGHDKWPNAIELDWRHAANISKGYVAPLDMDFLRGLLREAKTPQLPRFGLWQRWRSHSLTFGNKDTVAVPIFGPGGLEQQFEIAASGPDYKNSIRRALRRWHERVKEEWPTCPNVLTKDELLIHPQQGPKMVADPRLRRCLAPYEGNTNELFDRETDRRVKVVSIPKK